MLGQFGALASMTGLGSSLGIKNPVDLYIGILQSQSVTDAMIKRFDLMRALPREKDAAMCALLLQKSSKFVAGKDGMITISVTDHDPARPRLWPTPMSMNSTRLTTAWPWAERPSEGSFLSNNWQQEKDRLADAEVALKKTEEVDRGHRAFRTNGDDHPPGCAVAGGDHVARSPTGRTANLFHGAKSRCHSPQYRTDMACADNCGIWKAEPTKHAPGDISITTANVPQAGLEYIRKERDVKYHQFLFDLLARQYEAARMDEAKAAPVIQVVDPALLARQEVGALPGIVGISRAAPSDSSLAPAGCSASHIYRSLEADEEQGRRLAVLRQELKLRG